MSFTYGVSPQPAQAPENSKSGRMNWEPLIVFLLMSFGSTSGSERKKSKFAASWSRSGSWGAMLMAFLSVFSPSTFLYAGQALTQTPQPVQSRDETWIVNFMPLNSLPFASMDLNVARRLGRAAPGRRPSCG